MDYYDRQKSLTILASIDESEPYEVDEAIIGLDQDGRFVLLTASGCSCWDGDYDEEVFDSLDALEKALIQGDEDGNDKYHYNPSLNGARALVAEAREQIKDGKL